ncbi:MAG TPA: alpha/beta hydrolase [Puia sp.]|nr:alpha/beta hydrolase [Puia sp.]
MKKAILVSCLLAWAVVTMGQKVYDVWPGKAPGAENWNWTEKLDSIEFPGDLLAYNVVKPTLTYYPADSALANGTAVIICPGGSFCYLHINTEGADVARWLNKIGVSAFVLKYRLVHSETIFPVKEKNEKVKDTANARKAFMTLIPLAIADAKEAIAYVRKRAHLFGLAPNKIGIMGFSAGGALATAVAFDYTPANKPYFVAPIYAYVPPFLSMSVQKDSPPLFIAAASDDELHLVPMSIGLYNKWLAAGISAEIHIYAKGGHGFGMNKQGQPSDTWIDRFGDWLAMRGFLTK